MRLKRVAEYYFTEEINKKTLKKDKTSDLIKMMKIRNEKIEKNDQYFFENQMLKGNIYVNLID